jgi:hypothetical protein
MQIGEHRQATIEIEKSFSCFFVDSRQPRSSVYIYMQNSLDSQLTFCIGHSVQHRTRAMMYWSLHTLNLSEGNVRDIIANLSWQNDVLDPTGALGGHFLHATEFRAM